MSVDYASKARSTDRMIRAYGTTGALTAVTAAYDPATGGTTPSTITQTVQMVAFDYPQHMIDGSLIRMGDKQALVSAIGVTAPKPGNSLLWGSIAYTVISVKALGPALINVLFELQIRG